MRNYVRIALATAIAIVTLGAATSAALGEDINFATTTSTQTLPLTLRDSALGNIILRIVLTFTLRSARCPASGTVLLQVGGLVRGTVVVSSPAGLTGSIAPSLIFIRCIGGRIGRDAIGQIIHYKLRKQIILNGTPVGTITYTGDLTLVSAASPAATWTGTSGTFTSSIGTTATALPGFVATNSPAISYTTIGASALSRS